MRRDDTKNMVERLAALQDISLRIAFSKTSEELLEHLRADIRQLFDATQIDLAIDHDETTQTWRLAGFSGTQETNATSQLDTETIWSLLAAQDVVNISNTAAPDNFMIQHLRDVGFESLLAAPVHVDLQPIGVLVLLSKRVGGFDHADETLATRVAALVGATLGNLSAATDPGPQPTALTNFSDGIASATNREILTDLHNAVQSREAVEDIVKTYLAEAPILIAQLKAATVAADFETARTLSHSLKSSSRVVGAEHLGDICHLAEMAAIDSADLAGADRSELVRLYEQIETNYVDACGELEAYVNQLV